ncbi:MAG: hypothetical protein FJX70_07100 [Alphaproteobacteria bacterium]|nr:hypothetical protein [Alphaproteobacteria bacterium]
MVIKKIAPLLTILLIANTTWADTYSKEEKTTNFIVTPSIAYRYDVFKWSIPAYTVPDKKVSELTWKNYIVQPSIKIETEPQENWFTFLAQGKYGYILKNKSKSWDKDWEFHKPKRSNKIKSKIYSNTVSAVKGNIFDLSGAIGYSVNLFGDNLLTFYLGYDYSNYKNSNYGARQLVDNQNYVVFSSDQLVTRYNFKTKAPWIGLSVNIPINDKFLVKPIIKYYSFKYVGKGYWVHRDDLKQNPSLKHNAKGQGFGADIDLVYKYSNNLDFNINLGTKNFKMRKGQAQDFIKAMRAYTTHTPQRTVTRKLWDLSFRSYSISSGIKYSF